MAAPTSIDEVVTLIKKFYDRGQGDDDSDSYSEIDKTLTSLQQSDHGFQLADELLKKNEQEVRFFGASTFHRKMENGLPGFTEEAKAELLDRLLMWVVTACDNGFTRATTGQLCSCLALYFVHTHGKWENCILNVLATLAFGAPRKIDTPPHMDAVKEVINNLSANRQYALYNFLETFQECIHWFDHSAKASVYHDQILANLPVIAKIIEFAFNNVATIDDDYVLWVSKTLQSLVTWVKDNTSDPKVGWDVLRPTIEPFIASLTRTTDTETATSQLCEIISDCPSFLQQQHHQAIEALLTSPEVEKLFEELEAGEFDDQPWFLTRFLLDYCTVRTDKLISDAPDGTALLYRILRITNCAGVAILEDEIIPYVVEFWQNFCENLSMVQFASEGNLNSQYWLHWYDGILPKMAQAAIQKSRLPSEERMKTWLTSEKARFAELRSSISSMMGSLCELLGTPLIEHVVSYVWACKANRDWTGVESGMHCLNYIQEYMETDEDEKKVVAVLLGSSSGDEPPLLLLLDTDDIPSPTIQKAIMFIDTYKVALTRQEKDLPDVLNFLSRCLQAAPRVAAGAAKAISSLCLVGRVKMTTNLHSLLTLYENYAASHLKREFAVQEKLAGALSAVIQAATVTVDTAVEWRKSDAIAILDRLLGTIESDVGRAQQLLSQGYKNEAYEVNLGALSCIRSMGKAFREPGEAVIDLDDDESSQIPPNIWVHVPDLVSRFQQRILSICSMSLTMFNGSDEIEAFCSILRAGYTEERPGPFVFPISATQEFVKQCSLTTSRIGMVLETVGILMRKHKSRSAEIDLFALSCLKHIRSMIEPFFHVNPSEDPEIASIVIDFFKDYIPRYTDCLLNNDEPEDLRHSFDFLLACFGSHEIMPKRSAASFWGALVKDKGQHSYSEAGIEACLSEYSMSLAEIIARDIGGGASRSELDNVCEPLRALVFRGGAFQMQFRQAVTRLQIPESRVSVVNKKTMVDQVLKLRGGPKTNKIIKEFWTACRGTFAV